MVFQSLLLFLFRRRVKCEAGICNKQSDKFVFLCSKHYLCAPKQVVMKDKGNKRKPMGRVAFWLNILAMLLVVVVAIWLTFRRIDSYTQHGMAILVPDVTNVDESEAITILQRHELQGLTSDHMYVKDVPAGTVVIQRPKADAKVKRGRTVYLTVSSGNEPMVVLPDVADNSSYRQAASQLRAAGFLLTENDTIRGELDWVYKVLWNGQEIYGGQKIPEGSTLTLVVGNGMSDNEIEDKPEVDDDFF